MGFVGLVLVVGLVVVVVVLVVELVLRLVLLLLPHRLLQLQLSVHELISSQQVLGLVVGQEQGPRQEREQQVVGFECM